MLIKNGKGPTIYSILGSAAALMEEKVWDKLLRGERVGIMENDDTRYSLFADGNFIEAFAAQNPAAAIAVVRTSVPFLNAQNLWSVRDGKASAHARGCLWELQQGYPTILECSPSQRIKHERAGRTSAKKIAHYYKALIEANIKAQHLDEEITRHGLTREGRD